MTILVSLCRARETFCTSQEDSGRSSTSFSLLELYDKCQSESNVTLPDSNTASPDHDAFNFTSDDATAVVTTDSALLTKDLTHTSSLIQGDVWNTAASNPTLTKDSYTSSLTKRDARSTAASNPTLAKDTYTSSPVQWDVMSTAASNPKLTKDTYTSSLIHRNVMSTAASNPTEPMLTKANSSSHEEEAVSESTSNPPSLASVTSFPVFLQELFAQSSHHSSTSQTGTEQQQRGLRTTDATFPQEGPFNQTTSDYSTGTTGVSHTTNHRIHSLATHAVEGAPRTSPPQLNSTRSSARSEPTPTTPSPHYVDDYDYEEQPKETPVQLAHIACDYNPCRHLQKPCSELQSISQCSCPGTSSEDEVPDPPRLREVIEITDSSAQIRWCAPYSVVHTYELILHAQDNEDRQFVMDNIYPTARQYTLYNLLPFTTYHICVTASNKAGSSQTTGQEIPGNSCTRFKTKPSYKYVFAALSAASGLFLITTIILSVCLCKACKKPQSEQYGTHLVSYKNPAFDHPLKLQATN